MKSLLKFPKNIFSLLWILPCLLHAENPVDTFRVHEIPLVVQAPVDWIRESLEDSVKDGTSWNFIMRSVIDKPELSAHVAIKIVQNEKTTGRAKKSRAKYTVTEQYKEGWGCYYVDYKPVKASRGRKGKQYTYNYVTPLSDGMTMYLLFAGNGSPTGITALHNDYLAFVDSFFVRNKVNMEHFLMLNELHIPNTQKSMEYNKEDMYFFYNARFTFFHSLFRNDEATVRLNEHNSRRAIGYTLEQKNAFNDANLRIAVEFGNDELGPDSATHVYHRPRKVLIDGYYYMQMHLEVVAYRKFITSKGTTVKLAFVAEVPVGDGVMKAYYVRVVDVYANQVTALNRSIQAQKKKE
jgi:hypothetical protein